MPEYFGFQISPLTEHFYFSTYCISTFDVQINCLFSAFCKVQDCKKSERSQRAFNSFKLTSFFDKESHGHQLYLEVCWSSWKIYCDLYSGMQLQRSIAKSWTSLRYSSHSFHSQLIFSDSQIIRSCLVFRRCLHKLLNEIIICIWLLLVAELMITTFVYLQQQRGRDESPNQFHGCCW